MPYIKDKAFLYFEINILDSQLRYVDGGSKNLKGKSILGFSIKVYRMGEQVVA